MTASIGLDDNGDHSESNPRLAGRIGGVQTESAACLECIAEIAGCPVCTGECCHSGSEAKDIQCGGGNLGTCPHEVFPRSERCHQKSVLLSASVPRCYDQGKMQRRLPAGSPGDVESPGSSGRPDSELSHVPPLQTN